MGAPLEEFAQSWDTPCTLEPIDGYIAQQAPTRCQVPAHAGVVRHAVHDCEPDIRRHDGPFDELQEVTIAEPLVS